jgi:hypothetical protein
MEQIIPNIKLEMEWSQPLEIKDLGSLPDLSAFYAFILIDGVDKGVVKIGATQILSQRIKAYDKEIWENKDLRIVYGVFPSSFIMNVQKLIRDFYRQGIDDKYTFALRMARVLYDAYLKKWRKPSANLHAPIKRDYIKHIELEEKGTLRILDIPPANITRAFVNNFKAEGGGFPPLF